MDDDRTAKARLRDAAVELVADGGTKALSARAVADRAELSQGLIRHHFGSMAALLRECDAHVAEQIREGKEQVISPGPGFDPLSALNVDGRERVVGYLAARLTEDSEHLDGLVDTLIDDATGYITKAVEAGLMRGARDERQRAAILTVYSLGSIVMHRHVARHLGVDLSSADFASQPGYLTYVRLQLEAFAALFQPEVGEQSLGYIDSMEEGT